MKRYILGIILFLSILLLSGCGKEIVCTKSETADGKTSTVEVKAKFNGSDKLTSASITYDFGDQTSAEQICNLFKESDKYKDMKIDCSGSKIVFKDAIKLLSDEASESAKERTREEVIKSAEEDGYTCK